jgi:hypothetical protein
MRSQDAQKQFKVRVVWSSAEAGNLPQNLADRNINALCVVEINPEHINKTAKNKHWWNKGPKYYEAEFELRLIPTFAALRFEVLTGGKLVEPQDKVLRVDWDIH